MRGVLVLFACVFGMLLWCPTALQAQQHLVLKTAGDKFKGLVGRPISEWPDELTKNCPKVEVK